MLNSSQGLITELVRLGNLLLQSVALEIYESLIKP